jgi:magnesium-protoporphyrin O-methyltransferase
MAFTSSIFSHIPLNNQRIYSPSFHKPKLLRTTVTAASLPPISASIAAEIDGATLAVIGGGSVAVLAAAISLKDPERRRRPQAEELGG